MAAVGLRAHVQMAIYDEDYGDEWLEQLDLGLVRRLTDRRTFDQAIEYGFRYAVAPSFRDHELRAVVASNASEGGRRSGVFGDKEKDNGRFDVVLFPDHDGMSLVGECSRCWVTTRLCVHVTTLAIDVASSAALKAALLAAKPAAEEAARAVESRLAIHVESRFARALEAWIAPTEDGERIEISATPFAEADPYIGRGYGDSYEERVSVLTISVRRVGERKLLSPRDVKRQMKLTARDRRVLDYPKNHGTTKKALYATGIDASLAIEAMRHHGGIFATGFRELLEFRSSLVKPYVGLRTPESGESSSSSSSAAATPHFVELAASWITESGDSIAFDDSVYFRGPFSFVWTRGGGIYRVAKHVDPEFVAALVREPVIRVPRSKLKEAGSRLYRAARGHALALPSHDTFGLPAVEMPRLVLRLSGEPLAVTGEFVAIYRGRENILLSTIVDDRDAPASGSSGPSSVGPSSAGPAGPSSSGPGSSGPSSQKVGFDGSDIDTEERGIKLVRAAGLFATDEDGADLILDGHRVAVAGENAVTFWQKGLLELRAATDPPIEVELSERLARVKIGMPVVSRVHVALEGDWLDTRLDFRSSELPIELSAIRTALLRKERWVALRDGTLARISESIGSLADEAGELFGDDADHARLPAHQLGRLDRWLEENDGRMDEAVETLRKKLRALAVATEPEMPEKLSATLRPYQRLGLAWLQFLQGIGAGGILADDMGLGKTITALAFLLRRKEAEGGAPSLVVCPTSVATNWVREAERFTPTMRVLLLHGASRESRREQRDRIAKSDLVITTYGLLRRDIDDLAEIPFRAVVLDEAQQIKNADSATRRAAGRLNGETRLALSGTPIENRLRELWSIASFVNPGVLGTVRAFEKRYERPIAMDRKSPLAGELRAIMRPFILRRTKNDVLRELPPKTEVDRIVTLTTSDKRMYDALALTLRESVARTIEKRGLGQSSLSVFTALMRLRQMACDPRLVDEKLVISESAKRAEFLELVRELVAEGRRALVFSQFVQLLTLWRKDLDAEGIAYEYLDGSTKKRDEAVVRFQTGTAPLFLISLKAGGAGLNLTAADTVIHCDPWWNPAVEEQASDRAHRIGQNKPVTVVRLIARGTIEEKILSLKAKKRELVQAVIGDDARALEGLNEADIRLLLGDAEGDVDVDLEGEDERENGAPKKAAPKTAEPTKTGRPSPKEAFATAKRVENPEFYEIVEQAQRWIAETGRFETDLADCVDIPVPFATRLVRGEPFPCSRAVAERIRTRLKAWR